MALTGERRAFGCAADRAGRGFLLILGALPNAGAGKHLRGRGSPAVSAALVFAERSSWPRFPSIFRKETDHVADWTGDSPRDVWKGCGD